MGASSDYMEVSPSSKGEVDDMDMDKDLMDTTNLNELGKETLQSFCKKAASLFFLTNMVSSVTKSTYIMLSSTVDSRGSLIHLVRLLLSLDTIHLSRRMVNGDVHQLGLERSPLIDQAFGMVFQVMPSIICFSGMPGFRIWHIRWEWKFMSMFRYTHKLLVEVTSAKQG